MAYNNIPIMHTDPSLPPMWKREVKEKPGKGKTIRHEVTLISPEGLVFKNVSQLEKYLKNTLSVYKSNEFDFTLHGKANSKSRKRKSADAEYKDSTDHEATETGGRRRSGRIQQKQRSHDEEPIEPEEEEIHHVKGSPNKKRASPGKVTPPTTPTSKKGKKHVESAVHEVAKSDQVDAIVETHIHAKELLEDNKPDDTVAVVHQETTTTTTVIGHDEKGQETEITSVLVEKTDTDIVTNESPEKTLEMIDETLKETAKLEDAIENKIVNDVEALTTSEIPLPSVQPLLGLANNINTLNNGLTSTGTPARPSSPKHHTSALSHHHHTHHNNNNTNSHHISTSPHKIPSPGGQHHVGATMLLTNDSSVNASSHHKSIAEEHLHDQHVSKQHTASSNLISQNSTSAVLETSTN